jgi:ABC-type transport system substrate-binding protein
MTKMQKRLHMERKPMRWKLKLVVTFGLIIGATSCSDTTSTPPPTPTVGGAITVGIFDTLPGFCVGNNPANSALMATRTMYETLFERTDTGDMVGLLAQEATASTDQKALFRIRLLILERGSF